MVDLAERSLEVVGLGGSLTAAGGEDADAEGQPLTLHLADQLHLQLVVGQTAVRLDQGDCHTADRALVRLGAGVAVRAVAAREPGARAEDSTPRTVSSLVMANCEISSMICLADSPDA